METDDTNQKNIPVIQPTPADTIPVISTPKNPKNLFFIIAITVTLIATFGSGGYILGNNQNNNKGNVVPSPVITQATYSPIPSQSAVSPVPLPANCTADTACPSGYGCEALQGQGTACPISNNTIQPNGSVTHNTVISCTPTYSITKGECKLKKDGICSHDNDCMSGLICHDISPNTSGYQIKKCEEPIVGTCSGASDTSCPKGYQCSEGCGPPLLREGENNTPPWYCTAKEIAGRPRACPICLASNTMIATPQGEVNVKNIKVGMQVWSVNKKGEKITSKVIKIGNTIVPSNHKVVHLLLSDDRNLWVSANHPTITGIVVGELRVGAIYDNAKIREIEVVPYWDAKTYDLLPDSETGFYYANGIRMGSTLK